MENDFHLSIKNHQRKIGDVRDLFRNLTNDEKQCLLKEKILSEQKINELRRLRELEDQEKEQQILEHKNQNKNQDFLKRSKYNNLSNNFQNLNKKMNDEIENNNKLTNYEEKVIKTYGLLNQQANDDFGKYLEDDDDDIDKAINNDRKTNFESRSINDGRRQSSKKIRKNSTSKINNSSESIEKQQQQTDMCGFYAMELSPKEKERMEKLKQQQNKGGFAGLKSKIKSLFTLEDNNSYNLQAPVHHAMPMGYDDVELSGLDSEDIQSHNYYLPRTINDVQYGSSKIGYQNDEEGYKEYYNQVDDLRKFDYEARVNNLKWRPNDNVAIMDDDLNVKYTKSKNLSKESKSKNSNNEKPAKKQNKFNRLTEAIISKAKSLRT